METFLVRIWTEPDRAGVPEPARPLRGLVQHVRSGAEARFADPAELVGVLERLSRPVPIPAAPAGDPGHAESR